MKKRVYILFVLVSAAVWWTGCSDGREDDILSGQAITFSCNAVNTRAEETTADNIASFRVSAVWAKAAGVYVNNFMDGVPVEKSGNDWIYSPVMYMPSYGTVDFFAYSPSNDASVSNFLIDGANNRFSLDYEVTDNLLKQQDFMVAKAPKQETVPIPLEFRHALSSVTVEVRNNSVQEHYFRIRDVKLCNLYRQGTLKGSSTGEWEWSGQSTKTDYTVALNGFVDVYFGTSYIPVSHPAVGPLMVLPQTADTDTDTGFKIIITYDIVEDWAGESLIAKDETKVFSIHAPGDPGTGFTFELGKKYTFRIDLIV